MEQTAEQRIAAVEQNLRPSMVVQGQPIVGVPLAARMAHYNVPAVSVAVIRQGRIDWARAYGLREAGLVEAVTPATLFQAASISKPVAALVAVALAEAGQLDLDADVNTLLRSWQVPANEFTHAAPVTLRRILSHTAGLTVQGLPGYAAGDALPTPGQILDGVPPANSEPIVADVVPGTLGRYSGGGYVLLQQLLEDVLGRSFPAICRDTVLAPLDMCDSTYEQPLPSTWHGVAAVGHRPDGSPVAGR
jgi:CubicO group peptidase (beta-lactamase class C family)